MIEEIQEKIKLGEYEYSRHAVDQSILREISNEEIIAVIQSGEIIEDYPQDKYGPSCLIAGSTPKVVGFTFKFRIRVDQK